MDTFFPQEDYKMPETSNYLKLTEGEHTFRIISSAIVGWEYFTTEKKPVRSKTPFEDTPGIKYGDQPKHFWAFLIWNRDAKKIQIMQITNFTVV